MDYKVLKITGSIVGTWFGLMVIAYVLLPKDPASEKPNPEQLQEQIDSFEADPQMIHIKCNKVDYYIQTPEGNRQWVIERVSKNTAYWNSVQEDRRDKDGMILFELNDLDRDKNYGRQIINLKDNTLKVVTLTNEEFMRLYDDRQDSVRNWIAINSSSKINTYYCDRVKTAIH